MSVYDFETNPRAWTFAGEIRAVKVNSGWFGSTTAYQWIFEKEDCDAEGKCCLIRIGVMMHEGRLSISDPPAGE